MGNKLAPPKDLHQGDCFKKEYTRVKKLGSGAFSTVYLSKHNAKGGKGDFFAIKVITKSGLTEEDLVGLKQEIDILREIKHPNVIGLYSVYENSKTYQLVTELVSGGELFERIVEKESYSEADARVVVRTLMATIAFLHDREIVHRDLKPENVLLTSKDDSADIKVADFGFAKHMADSPVTACGTPGFVAPEIISGKKYNAKVDVWSCGVIIYIMLCGYPPFYDENQGKLFAKIKAGKYSFHKKYWAHISQDAKDLIKAMLTVDVDTRISAKDSLKLAWLSGSDASHTDLGMGLETLKTCKTMRFEHGHDAIGPHANPHEHGDEMEHIEGGPATATK